MRINIGLDFIDSFGDRITCVQLVNDQEKSVAICDFQNDVPIRLACIESVDRIKFRQDAFSALASSKPERFGK